MRLRVIGLVSYARCSATSPQGDYLELTSPYFVPEIDFSCYSWDGLSLTIGNIKHGKYGLRTDKVFLAMALVAYVPGKFCLHAVLDVSVYALITLEKREA